jgi:nicotinamidase/pyrazinamidase
MRTVFFDVDTQLDFMYPAGALYVPGAETIVERIAQLNRFAAAHDIPLISTMDAHDENDREFLHWPPHCVKGTLGQRKPEVTLVGSPQVIPFKPRTVRLTGAKQILLEKTVLDCFENVNLSSVLEFLQAERYVVYGVVTEICVRFAASGLLKTGKPVAVVTDAVRSLNDLESAKTIADFQLAGGSVTTVSEISG